MRLSRSKQSIRGTLKGLSAKEYYTITSLKNPVPSAKQFLPENIYTKFNRGKPLSPEQAKLVFHALNKVVFEWTKHVIPIITPDVKLKVVQRISRYKAIYNLSLSLVRLNPTIVSGTKCYHVGQKQIVHKKQSGLAMFSGHSIDRIVERSGLFEYCPADTMLIIAAMQKSVDEGIVEVAERDVVTRQPQLKFGPLGYCPMQWDDAGKCWVLTTFLEKDMLGTGGENTRRVKEALKQLSDKYEVADHLMK